MSELLDKAIAHITDQAMEIDHPFAIFIEEHLTNICTTEAVANKLLDESKSLKEFCKNQEDEMREQAKKKGSGLQCAGLSDAEFYSRAEAYYCITEEDKNSITVHPKQEPKKIVNIMDLL